MAVDNRLQGVSKQQEQEASKFYRDTRTMGQKFGAFIASENAMVIPITAIPFSYFLPGLTEIAMICVVWCYFYFMKKNKSEGLPYRMPASAHELDPNTPSRKDGKPSPSNGIMYLGNERDPNTNNEIWFSNSDARTHMLVFGTTGAGKTEALLGFAYNALVQGSGFIYVDGKGTNELYSKVVTMIRTLGRDDDTLLINYMTGGTKDIGDIEIGAMLSNTVNPFASGSSAAISEFFTGLMSSGGSGDDMWAGRARTFITALVRVLVWMRDQGEITMYVDEIRDYMELPKLVKLISREDIPESAKAALTNYVVNLPGMDAKSLEDLKNNRPLQQQTVYEQHGFITMQLTEIMNLFADDYAHIFKAPMGEVDFFDVVANRRILVVLLPALEKSTGSLSNLGKIIVAGLKNTMAASMGTDVEGARAKIIDSRPTNAPTPYITILDEYGYYAVEGSAVMPAQARGLGFCMIFAGQDYPAFKKASPEEAASIVANTTVKICMKLEDPDETFEIFAKAAGESKVTQVGGFQQNIGATINYTDMGTATIEKQARIDVRDLKKQIEGEAHILYGDKLARIRTFYTAAEAAEYTYVNSFLVIKTYVPDEVEVVEIPPKLMAVIKGKEELKDDGMASIMDCIMNLSKAFASATKDRRKVSPLHASIYALGSHQKEKEELAMQMSDVFNAFGSEETEDKVQKRKSKVLERMQRAKREGLEEGSKSSAAKRASEKSSDSSKSETPEDIFSKKANDIRNSDKEEGSVETEGSESDALNLLDGEMGVSGLEEDLGLDTSATLADLSEIDALAGVSPKQAEENAEKVTVKIREEIKSYKPEPTPKRNFKAVDEVLHDLEAWIGDE